MDYLRQVADGIRKSSDLSKVALKRTRRKYLSGERIRDVFDWKNSFTARFDVKDTTSSVTLNLMFEEPVIDAEIRSCCGSCYCSKVETFNGYDYVDVGTGFVEYTTEYPYQSGSIYMRYGTGNWYYLGDWNSSGLNPAWTDERGFLELDPSTGQVRMGTFWGLPAGPATDFIEPGLEISLFYVYRYPDCEEGETFILSPEQSYQFSGNGGAGTMVILEIVPYDPDGPVVEDFGGAEYQSGPFNPGTITGTGMTIAGALYVGGNAVGYGWDSHVFDYAGYGSRRVWVGTNTRKGTLSSPLTDSLSEWGGGWVSIPVGGWVRQVGYAKGTLTGQGCFVSFPNYTGAPPSGGNYWLQMPLQAYVGSFLIAFHASGDYFGGGLQDLPAGSTWTQISRYVDTVSWGKEIDCRFYYHVMQTSMVFAQARAKIIPPPQKYAQARPRIKATYDQYAQSEADIV